MDYDELLDYLNVERAEDPEILAPLSLEPAQLPTELIPEDPDDVSLVEMLSGNRIKYPSTGIRKLAQNTAKTLLGSGYNKDSKRVEPWIRKNISDNDYIVGMMMGAAYGLPVIGPLTDMIDENLPGLLDITGLGGIPKAATKAAIKSAAKTAAPSMIMGMGQGAALPAIYHFVKDKPRLEDHTQEEIDDWWNDQLERYR